MHYRTEKACCNHDNRYNNDHITMTSTFYTNHSEPFLSMAVSMRSIFKKMLMSLGMLTYVIRDTILPLDNKQVLTRYTVTLLVERFAKSLDGAGTGLILSIVIEVESPSLKDFVVVFFRIFYGHCASKLRNCRSHTI